MQMYSIKKMLWETPRLDYRKYYIYNIERAILYHSYSYVLFEFIKYSTIDINNCKFRTILFIFPVYYLSFYSVFFSVYKLCCVLSIKNVLYYAGSHKHLTLFKKNGYFKCITDQYPPICIQNGMQHVLSPM